MTRIANLRSECGAVLVQTAISAFVLVGFGAFVIDHGILWVGRHQAQNAADAGAMAGALARAYEDFDDPPAALGVADQLAAKVATTNLVWGESSPGTAAVTSFECPPEIGGTDRCVRVDVYRNGESGSRSLPTLFGPLISIGSQRTKATASARVQIANATNCLRPWAIPDKWIENAAGADFKKYDTAGALLTPHDDYQPPGVGGPGTGYQYATSNAVLGDLGALLGPLLFDDLTIPAGQILPTSVVPLALTGGYGASLAACNGQAVTVGDQIPISPTPASGADFAGLLDDDPDASWDDATKTIHNSCAPTCGFPSRRVAAVAVFDVDVFQYRQATSNWSLCPPASVSCVPCPAGAPCVTVANIVGLFVVDSTPTTRLTSYSGIIPTEAPRLTATSSFLKAVNLVR